MSASQRTIHELTRICTKGSCLDSRRQAAAGGRRQAAVGSRQAAGGRQQDANFGVRRPGGALARQRRLVVTRIDRRPRFTDDPPIDFPAPTQ
jgi:hypothetical protein